MGASSNPVCALSNIPVRPGAHTRVRNATIDRISAGIAYRDVWPRRITAQTASRSPRTPIVRESPSNRGRLVIGWDPNPAANPARGDGRRARFERTAFPDSRVEHLLNCRGTRILVATAGWPSSRRNRRFAITFARHSACVESGTCRHLATSSRGGAGCRTKGRWV
jgi:hypothetical protein